MSFHGFLTNSLTNDFSSCRKMTQRCSGWLGNTIALKLWSQRLNCFIEKIWSASLVTSLALSIAEYHLHQRHYFSSLLLISAYWKPEIFRNTSISLLKSQLQQSWDELSPVEQFGVSCWCAHLRVCSRADIADIAAVHCSSCNSLKGWAIKSLGCAVDSVLQIDRSGAK